MSSARFAYRLDFTGLATPSRARCFLVALGGFWLGGGLLCLVAWPFHCLAGVFASCAQRLAATLQF